MALNPQNYPNLSNEGYSIESPATPAYNCVAWAADDDTKWWDPIPSPFAFWPNSLPHALTVDVFILLFEHLGYSMCQSSKPEKNYEKVAIYGVGGIFKHVARQTKTGNWTSKIGQNIDIETTLKGLEGPFYGQVVAVLRRKL